MDYKMAANMAAVVVTYLRTFITAPFIGHFEAGELLIHMQYLWKIYVNHTDSILSSNLSYRKLSKI